MEANQVPGALTNEEFNAMMREFDIAGDWMLEQLAQRRRQAQAAARAGRDADGFSDEEEHT